jgi:reverse gyrase
MVAILVDSVPEELRNDARRHLLTIRRIMRKISPAALQVLAQKLKEKKKPENDIERAFAEAAEFVRNALKREDVLALLRYSNELVLRREDGRTFIYIPDTMTYI